MPHKQTFTMCAYACACFHSHSYAGQNPNFKFIYKINFILVVSRPSGVWHQSFENETIFLNTKDQHVPCCADMF